MQFQSSTLLFIIISIIVFEYFLNTLLDILNFKTIGKPIPHKLKGIYEEEKYQKALLYQKEQAIFGFITGGFALSLSLGMLAFGGFGWLNQQLLSFNLAPIWVSLFFFGSIFIVSDVLNMPFEWYSTFVIEAKYGFNKMDIKTFILDKIKGYALAFLIGGLLLGLLLYLIQYLGKDFWWIFWAITSVFMLAVNMFYTSLIVPIFNKLTPLEDGELKTAIMEYCKKVHFPLDNLFVIDGSKRSTKANAYFSGIGSKKKIVLYDTLIKDHSIPELVAVLAHEVGHFKKKHIIWSLGIGILQMGFTFYILSLMVFNQDLSLALGAKTTTIHLNLIAFGILYSPISTLTSLLMSIFSRKNEYEADDFAKNTYAASALISALKKLSVNNLSNLTPHPLYVFFNYSHPPLAARLENLEM
jgi:STE24 endopeptidase